MPRDFPARSRGVILFGAAVITTAVLVGCDTTFAYVYPDRGHGYHGYRGHDRYHGHRDHFGHRWGGHRGGYRDHGGHRGHGGGGHGGGRGGH